MVAIYLFNRALRLHDNICILEALRRSIVLPLFCVDPRQASPKKNPYFSPYALGFMLQSLEDLQEDLRSNYRSDLLLLLGEPHIILPKLISRLDVTHVYLNEDYTPFARKRVEEIRKACPGVEVVEVADHLLFDPKKVRTKAGTAHRVYTVFRNDTEKRKVDEPKKLSLKNGFLSTKQINDFQKGTGWSLLRKHSKYAPLYTPGGRKEGLRRLKNLPITQEKYAMCRNYLKYRTSNLSAYIKFGCISIREAWYGMGKIRNKTSGRDIKGELIWREFFYHYYIAYPEELGWKEKYPEAKVDAKAHPIVQKCYQDLDQTGFLHNRGRMILAHDLLHRQKIYWKSGDKMYAKRLVDYDPIVNIGNWRWIVKQPPFKHLIPRVQAEKWDRDCQ